ncbi:MAG: hypothetical protein OXG11_09595 [Chloroflexi bacterium]|nr:hypothetical protein [Chloroflexota bacterium]
MPKSEDKPKRPRGRPRVHPMPERIDATPEEIADAILKAPPKSEWRYLKAREEAKSG